MKIKRQPTVSDVARLAGVGTTTVSRVINGGERVSPETFAAVTRAIGELDFVPNMAARVLKGEQSKTIGLIVPSIADPFFANCAEVVQTIARSYGCLVAVCVTGNEASLELENIDSLCRRVDGILIAPSNSSSKSLNARLSSLSIPVVYFDQPLSGTHISGVMTNNYESSRAITNHLLQHGYERILCIGGEADFYTMRERIRGYTGAMKAAKKALSVDTAPHIRSKEETAEVLIRHLAGRRPPQAIYCLKNTTTIHTYDILQQLGVRVPQQVALAGHDDFLLASSLRPSVTVVRQPVEEIGRTAARLLFERLSRLPEKVAAKPGVGTKTVHLESHLVIRASCGCREAEPAESIPSFRLRNVGPPSTRSRRGTGAAVRGSATTDKGKAH